MEVAELMTRNPVTIDVGATLDAALDLMDEKGVRHLPVLEGDQLAGVVSDRDLLAATGWVRELHQDSSSTKRRVRDVMRRPPITALPEESAVTAALDLMLNGIGCLPVVKDAVLYGIVTEFDLLKAFVARSRQQTLEGDYNPLIRTRMTREPASAHVAQSVEDVADLCRRRRIRHVPIVDGGKLVGIVSDRDLRRAQGRGLSLHAAIRELMTWQPVTAPSGERLTYAAERMLEHKISALPVTDDGKLVGILTATDLVDHCMNTLWS